MLSESELQLVVGLCKTDRLPRLDGDPVVAMQLSLLGWLFASADVTGHAFAIYYISNGHYPALVL